MRKRPKKYVRQCQGPGCARTFRTANPHAKYHHTRCKWKAWDKRHPRSHQRIA